MKILSEKTKKEYATVEECLAAEKAFDEAQAKAKAEQERKAKARTERAHEVEEAYKEVCAAEKKYDKLLNAFLKDYGSFHMTLTGDTEIPRLKFNFPFLI